MMLREIMKKDIVTITPDMSVREAAKKMKDLFIIFFLIFISKKNKVR